MEIKNCIFTEEKDSVNQLIKVFYDDKVEFHTFNLDDPVVSDIVKNSGGVENIESNTRNFLRKSEKELLMYEKFKKHMQVSNDLSFLFVRDYDKEELFNLKIWLFDLPEVENCTNLDLKKQLRTSKDLVEVIGTYYLIKKEASQTSC
tara:strand:+ start:329 stop:769 length:441 start_codon:yes stop_codon:yes gene_type:complete